MEPPMYQHSPPLNLTGEKEAGPSPDAAADVHLHIDYDTNALEDGGGDGHCDGTNSELSLQPNDNSDQLSLSFRGQVYVFESVTPEKVQAVLLLLGGCELPQAGTGTGTQYVDAVPQQTQRVSMEFPTRYSHPQRAASLIRFRQKRKDRCFDKKVRYDVRQEVALRMKRNKGQFTSGKEQDGANSPTDQDSGQDGSQSETFCTHCGTSSKSTPMMRRGPSGPRSLCNACGLFWANKGTLRDLSKRHQESSIVPAEQVDQRNISDCGTASIPTHNDLVIFSGNDNQALVADH
ncbi:GATA transcription factor 25 [Vicia villosa]|uniref:GATA transcription factor 25 n=1 Tax=Vicia villosa TaxID=3911 RepID=UPI00273B8371|nr:GATA transcription factor 25 [Vicia villosa]